MLAVQVGGCKPCPQQHDDTPTPHHHVQVLTIITLSCQLITAATSMPHGQTRNPACKGGRRACMPCMSAGWASFPRKTVSSTCYMPGQLAQLTRYLACMLLHLLQEVAEEAGYPGLGMQQIIAGRGRGAAPTLRPCAPHTCTYQTLSPRGPALAAVHLGGKDSMVM